jgi:hypothetical protein
MINRAARAFSCPVVCYGEVIVSLFNHFIYHPVVAVIIKDTQVKKRIS